MKLICNFKKNLLLFFLIAFFCSINHTHRLFTQTTDTLKAKDLVHLSFEELMKVKFNIGTITGMEQSKVPLSITTITAEDIKHTPARNIYDLIGIYVTDALWMNQSSGKHSGIRGIIINANYKFLLLVNGVNIGLKNHPGAISELVNWNLSDIESVDIVRGPGAVRYGPGAIAGVISITTKI